jgi:hypothetical protein
MTLAELEDRALKRLGETSPGGSYYTPAQVRTALNEGQRLFAFLTLCLETTANFPLTANEPWYTPLSVLPDWVAPLRVRIAGTGGTKLEPKRLEELDALNPNWQTEPGPPRRYARPGSNLLAVHPQPSSGGSALAITYARNPIPLTGDGQSPEIPEEYHPDLILYVLPRLRANEGAEEWAKNLPDFERFWRAAKKLAMYVRARNQSAKYDTLPPEASWFDRSRWTKGRLPWQTTSDSRPERAAQFPPTT